MKTPHGNGIYLSLTLEFLDLNNKEKVVSAKGKNIDLKEVMWSSRA